MFITLEGIDGSGKTTQAEKIYSYLAKNLGEDKVLWTKEPGHWPGGGPIRETILHGNLIHDLTELYLFMADRCEHVEQVIRPALEEGKILICERYNDSTLAYQCWGRGISLDMVRKLIDWSNFPDPDVTLWFDMPLKKSFELVGKRGQPDRMESDRAFLARVRDGFTEIWNEAPERIVKIDADRPLEKVSEDLITRLDKLLCL